MEQQLERNRTRIPHTGMGSLHLRGTVAAFAATVVMTVLTAAECHGYLALTHPDPSLTPLLLFAAVYWIWWGFLAVAMWWFAQRWPSTLTCTTRTFIAHAILACLLALAHLALLQQLVNFSARHWGDTSPPLNYLNL